MTNTPDNQFGNPSNNDFYQSYYQSINQNVVQPNPVQQPNPQPVQSSPKNTKSESFATNFFGSYLFWIYCGAVVFGGSLFIHLLWNSIEVADWAAVFVAIPLTILTFILFFFILIGLDFFRVRTYGRAALIMGYIWGAACWAGFALWSNTNFGKFLGNLTDQSFAVNWTAAITAPIDEELIKGLGIAVVIMIFANASKQFNRPLQGFILGGFVGLGAQITENFLYAINISVSTPQDESAAVLFVSGLRFLTGIMSHWAMSAVAGVGIIIILRGKNYSTPKRIIYGLGFYLAAVFMHFIFDSPKPGGLEIFVLIDILISCIIFYLVYRFARSSEQRWVDNVQHQIIGSEPDWTWIKTRNSRKQERFRRRSTDFYYNKSIENKCVDYFNEVYIPLSDSNKT